ncbi:MAG: FlgD immunoglobulin-like domain containing protein, partial [Candidatus Cloacimonetes bacterium]|nr:FlgD immunoglobulin-like domain containing protein [Candidatus Cloacimonadota bacterium]
EIIIRAGHDPVGIFREQLFIIGIDYDLIIRSEFDPEMDDFQQLPIQIQLPDEVEDPDFQSVILVRDCYNNEEFTHPKILIQGLDISGGKGTYTAGEGSTWGYRGGGIFSEGSDNTNCDQKIALNWCKIHHNTATWGGGIYQRWSSMDIRHCDIYENWLSYTEPELEHFYPYGPRGGGSYTLGGYQIIKYSRFFNNSTYESLNNPCNWGNAPALYWEYDCAGTVGLEIKYSQFFNNESFMNNDFCDVDDLHSSAIIVQFSTHGTNSNVDIYNNTIVNNHSIVASLYDRYTALGLNHYHTGFGDFYNNIVWNNTYGNHSQPSITQRQVMGVNPDLEFEPVYIRYSDINNALNHHYYYYEVEGHPVPLYNIDADPVFIDAANAVFELKWDSTVRSPCIMSAFGVDGGGLVNSVRYDRLDMGAVQYGDYPHEYITYSFPPASQRNGKKWLSFPSMDRLWNPIFNNPSWAYTFFAPFESENILDEIRWKPGNQEEMAINIFESEFIGEDHAMLPQYGYKVSMSEQNTITREISTPGIMTPEDTPIQLYSRVAGNPNVVNENWIGYFVERTQFYTDAFGDQLSNLHFIQTQNWTASRLRPRPDSPWIVVLTQGVLPTLKYGDAVIVKCFNDASLIWNAEGPAREPIEKEATQYYLYEEKVDYIPFYVQFENCELPAEIGLFIDDVCKGATVVKDNLVEIQGYVVDDLVYNPEIELRMYYTSKAVPETVPLYTLWDAEKEMFVQQNPAFGQKQDYYLLQIKGDHVSQVIEPKLYISNYPNPFNPSTTLKFNLPEAGEVNLEIYNVKGQLVKTLVHGNRDAGLHTIVFNGIDNTGKTVSSGVYFAVLKAQGKVHTRKMLMMK